jgi:hypothetical protein
MSGEIMLGFVDYASFSFGFNRVRLVLLQSFLVRNWCGPWLAVEAVGAQDTAERASAIGQEAQVICQCGFGYVALRAAYFAICG